LAIISSEEISELRRISTHKEFPVYLMAYECVKDNLRGEEAIETINKDMPENEKITKDYYESMLRGFREKSPVLRAGRENKSDNTLSRYKSKIRMILDNITEDKVKKASLKDMFVGLGILDDKVIRREGKPTATFGITGKVTKEVTNKVTIEIDDLRRDIKMLTDVAKEHGIKVPTQEDIIQKMKDNNEVLEAEYSMVGNEEEDSD